MRQVERVEPKKTAPRWGTQVCCFLRASKGKKQMLVEWFLRKLSLFESCLSPFLNIFGDKNWRFKTSFRIGTLWAFLGVLPFWHSLAFENDLISKMYRNFQCSLFVDQATPFASARVLLAKMPRCSGDFVRWKFVRLFQQKSSLGKYLNSHRIESTAVWHWMDLLHIS